MATLGLVHTIHAVIPGIEEICGRLLPGVRTAHFLDETILRDVIARGGVDADITRRVAALVTAAERGGVDGVLMTCSSIGACAPAAQGLVSVPVRRIDRPMAAAAVRRGGTIAVAATLRTTLTPTVELLRDQARRRGKRAKIETALFAAAFKAVTSGHPERHDKILRAGLARLVGSYRTIVLAQASMARVLPQIEVPKGVKVLTSPESGVRQMRGVLAGARDSRPRAG